MYPRTATPKGCDEETLGYICQIGSRLDDDSVVNEISNLLGLDFVLDNQVVREASPGSPWTKLGSTNGFIIDNHRALLKRVIVERFYAMLNTDYRGMSALDMVELGLADTVKLFTKNEPHNARTLAEGRLRQISCVSICWNTISRLLYGRQNREEKHVWDCGSIPSLCGMGSSDDDLKYLSSVWEGQGFHNLAEADVSGWDWSVQAWELAADAERRILLCGAGPRLQRLMRNTHYVMSMKVFQLSSGKCISQARPGVLPSGWYCTTTTNSFVRSLAAHLVGARFYRVLGDDSVESFVDGAKLRYEELGHDVKFYNRCDTTLEFCSRAWRVGDWRAKLTSWPRTFYRILCQLPSCDFRRQFEFELRHNDELSRCLEVLKLVGWDQQIAQDRDASKEEDNQPEADDGSAESAEPAGSSTE